MTTPLKNMIFYYCEYRYLMILLHKRTWS